MTLGDTAGPDALDPAEQAALQRRTLRVLTGGQIVGSAALGSAVTVGAFVVQEILGSTTAWGGIATATLTMGTAFTSQVLSRIMRKRGRRPGLQLGYLLAVVGGVIAAVGAERHVLGVFLAGLFLYGNGQASNLLARYAATDLALPEHRGRAMSRIVFASTFGAVFGPLLVGPAEHFGQTWFGFHKYTGPWLAASVFFLFAATNTMIRLRPDPLVISGGTRVVVTKANASLRHAWGVIFAYRRARLALLAMVISQASMVAVMTMTPVHLKLHGHEGVSQYVVSLHIAGMYAFSPLVGRYSDRKGRVPTLVIGGFVLLGATIMAALAGDVEQLLFPALWGLGVGWSFGLIGGSSLLTESVPAVERVAVQGAADLTMSFCGGLAGFSSGFVRKAFGYHMLANGASVAVAVLLAAAITARRTWFRGSALEAVA